MEVKYFTNCKNPAELAEKYQTISQVFDFNGSPEVTALKQEVETEYKQRLSTLKAIRSSSNESEEKTLDEVIEEITTLGLSGEICGEWLWLTGRNAFARIDDLKELGFRYAKNKKAWYWRPDSAKGINQDPMSMEYIREKYGSKNITVDA